MKKILTGFKPTGELTIGNYMGAIKQMIDYQKEYETYVFVADLHCLTVDNDVLEVHKNIKDFVALFLACGVDPDKATIYIQSECPYIPAISWMIECSAYFGEMNRMIQFKEKTKKNENFNVGLFTYPALMTSDILSVDADIVPVGIDQKQHVELTKNIAIRYNKKYGNTFVVPTPMVSKFGVKVMDLQDPTKKMSKTEDSKKGVIALLDDLDLVRKKIMGATTDSDSKIKYDKTNKPGISNLMNIYSGLTGMDIVSMEKKFKDSNYGEFKTEVADALCLFLGYVQNKYKQLIGSDELDKILDAGAKKINEITKLKYEDMRKKMGVYR